MNAIQTSTPFGDISIRFFPRTNGKYGVVATSVNGAGIKVNGVEYSFRWDGFLSTDGVWKQEALSLDRMDKKEMPFPYKAREKVGNFMDNLCPQFFTHEVRKALDKEQKEADIAKLEGEIRGLEESLCNCRAKLAELKTS